MDQPKTILVFCLPGIGDALLVTPAFRALKEVWPNTHITALCMFISAERLLQHDPHVDEVIHFDFPKQGIWRSLLFLRFLRQRHFDAVMIGYPANRFEYNIIAWLTGAPVRVGHRYNHLDWLCGNWLNNRTVLEDDFRGNIEENLRLVELLTGHSHMDGSVCLQLPDEAHHAARFWLSEIGIANKLFVGFHPGGSTRKNHEHKRWAPGKFAELGKRISNETGATILLFGGPDEGPLLREIAHGIGDAVHLVMNEDVVLTGGIIAACKHFVSNDSALMHLAGALQVPTTAIFGPTNSAWVRMPNAPRKDIALGLDCQPCFYYSPRKLQCQYGDYRCLSRLDVDQVAAEVLRSLGQMPTIETEGVIDNSNKI